MTAFLAFTLGGRLERREIGAAHTVVGRARPADIVVGSPSVSRVHFRVWRQDGGCFVEDRSTCGTFVNDRLLAAPHRLAHGDQIRIGSAAQPVFVARFVDEAVVERAAAETVRAVPVAPVAGEPAGELAALRFELAVARDDLARRTLELRRAGERLQAAEAELAAREREVRELRAVEDDLRGALAAARGRADELARRRQADRAPAQARLDALEQERADLAADVARLCAQRAEHEVLLAAHEANLRTLFAEVHRLRDVLVAHAIVDPLDARLQATLAALADAAWHARFGPRPR